MQIKSIIILIFCLLPGCTLHAQQETGGYYLYDATPHLVLKSNLLYDLAGFNLGVEGRLNQRLTLDISANYNPFTFSNNRK